MTIEYHEMLTDRAVAALEQREQRELYRQDGRPMYSPEEQAERRAALRAPAIQATVEWERAADETIAAKRQELAGLEHVDPLDTLTTDQLARANQLRTFIAEDAARLPIPALVQRVSAVLARGDAVELALWHRYVAHRDAAILSTWREHGGRAPSDREAQERRPLVDSLTALAKRLDDPKRAERITAAQEAMKTASAAKFAAIRKRQALDGTAAARLEAKRADYMSVI